MARGSRRGPTPEQRGHRHPGHQGLRWRDGRGRGRAGRWSARTRPSTRTPSSHGPRRHGLARWLGRGSAEPHPRTAVNTGGRPSCRSPGPPIVQECPDVAAGQGQYLVTWQEPSTVSGYRAVRAAVPAGRHPSRSGDHALRRPRDRVLPGCRMERFALAGGLDGRAVGVAGRLRHLRVGRRSRSTRPGSVISAEAGAQRRPAVAGTGSGWVVAWGDFRNGNEDIYAARIAANGTVRDPDGLPVTTAAGRQQAPAVASMGGATLVAWTGPAVERRLLRADGSFAGGPVRRGRRRTDRWPRPPATTRLAVLFAGGAGDPVRLALVEPDGTSAGTRAVVDNPDGVGRSADDLTFDGSRFVFTASSWSSDFPSSHGVWIGTVAGGQVFRSRVAVGLLPAPGLGPPERTVAPGRRRGARPHALGRSGGRRSVA